jgi:class 3 adenylate cyclase
MQSGVVGLRAAVIAAWEADLRAVRQDGFDAGRAREALLFMQRFYGLIASLRPSIQRAWGPRGHVHVVASADIGGPGCRVSQSRIRLRNRGDTVSMELFTYADGVSKPNPGAGLDRSIRVVDADAFALVNDLYRTAVDFLQHALNIDLALGGSAWLYEHMAALHFGSAGRWPLVGDVYRRTTREFAVGDSYESMLAMFAPQAPHASHADGANGANGSNGHGTPNDAAEMRLSLGQLQRYVESHADLDNFLKVVRVAVEADQQDRRVTSGELAESLGLEGLDKAKLGRLVAASPDVAREVEASEDFAEWAFRPSYNVHFFRRAHTIEDFLAIESSLLPRAASDGATTTSPGGTSFKVEESATTLPDGIVTFLMTDVVDSTPLWLQSRGAMYQAMRRHDALLTAAIEATGGTVLKERGEGDSFFAVFLRATDAVVAAVEAQRALQAEEWPERLPLRVRMAVLTGEADATDRDYRSPAVNRCAKLRRRAVGCQILVSETTYSIVADILRDDISLVSVGKRRLEGHDRPEEIYVVQHAEVALRADVVADEVPA